MDESSKSVDDTAAGKKLDFDTYHTEIHSRVFDRQSFPYVVN